MSDYASRFREGGYKQIFGRGIGNSQGKEVGKRDAVALLFRPKETTLVELEARPIPYCSFSSGLARVKSSRSSRVFNAQFMVPAISEMILADCGADSTRA
jgi:hypothetical protein